MVNRTLPYVSLDNRILPELNSRGLSSSTKKSTKNQKFKNNKSLSAGHVSKQPSISHLNVELFKLIKELNLIIC